MAFRDGCHELEARDPYAKDPNENVVRSVYLRTGKYDAWIKKGSAAHVFDVQRLMPFVLRNPTSIWKGVRHDGEHWDEWICYCGVPQQHYSNGEIVPMQRPGYVFLSFVESGWYVFGFRLVKCDPIDNKLPEDWETRFDERIWP